MRIQQGTGNRTPSCISFFRSLSLNLSEVPVTLPVEYAVKHAKFESKDFTPLHAVQ